MRVVGIFIFAMIASSACLPIDDPNNGNFKGYRGVLSTDGRDLGKHELENHATFGTLVNGYVGGCVRAEDREGLSLSVAFDDFHRAGTFTIDRMPNSEGVDIDLAWSHHFIPKSDCSVFEVDDNPASLSVPYNGDVKLACKQPGANGDSLGIDVEIRGC